jgi:LmbE family N-acetylglucosaminyl deacetylase
VRAEVYVPDGAGEEQALKRSTDLGIVAHPDDLEILALPGILECFRRDDRWFSGVVVTDGAGSARSGPYANVSDDEMAVIRRAEQRKAALVGEYAAVAMLGLSSAQAKDPAQGDLAASLRDLLLRARPGTVYTHNLADRHDTHVAVALAAIAACRALPPDARPRRLLGGEVWRDLDWLCAADKVAEDVSTRESLSSALIGVFDSQIAGGKRYDLAVRGRRRAHATYHESHHLDASTGLAFFMDLTPLLGDAALDPAAFVQGHIDRFAAEVGDRIRRLTGKP